MEQIEETTKKLFSFELNVSLIDHIRQFEHKEHHFKPGFLEQIYAHLSFYKDTQEAESFNQYSTNQYGLTLQEIVLFVHFQFSAISNLQDFISLLQEDLKIRSLKISQINSTNILSIHTIEDMKSKINQEQVESILAQLKPVYAPKLKINILQDTEDLKRKAKSKYHIIREQAKEEEDEGQFSEDKLVKSEELLQEESPNEDTNSEQKSTTATSKEVLNTEQQEKQVVSKKEVLVTEKEVVKPKETTSPLTKIEGEFELNITYDLLMVAIMSKGKLDLHSVSYLSDKINDKTDLSLHHACFDFLEKREQREEVISSYNANYSNQFKEICNQCIKLQLNKEIYQQYRKRLTTFRQGKHKSQQGYLQMKKEVEQMLHEIQTFVQNFIVSRNKIQQHYLEKLLIGMLGHTLRQVRDSAVVLLNVLYDGVDWQLNSASTVKVFNVHRKFVINYLVESQDDSDIYVQLKSNIFIPGCHQSISSIHKPSIKEFRVINNRRFVHVNLHLGRFTRCGFYDWRIVRLGENDISNVYKFTEINDIVSQEIKGRIIVHPRITRDLQIHEVFVDLQNGVQDERTGKLTKRGNFKTVTEALPEYKERGVNCIYLMGALERDNGHCITQENEQMIHKTARPNASPLAVTNRDYPNSMMGGKDGFRELTRKAEDLNLHIIVDSLTRVSSSRMHRKYRKYQLQSLDNQGKLVNVFGTDGRAMHFEDTSLLNYRKKKCWDLFLKEIIDFTKQYKIQGIHLDNGQSWPQILRLNEEEMYRYDVDGSEAYTIKEIFEGKIVVQGEEQSGYWGSNAKETMPNPFLIKLCRKLWETYPHYLIISECWGKMGGFEEAREFSVIQSGPIPRLFKFPQAICQFFGKSLRKDGSIHKLKEPKNVSYFKKWYENTIDSLPENANVIQSTTYHTFPYPALLYKRGTWAAVDLFFFLGDLPMTFIGEKEGKATKVKTTNFFETLTVEQEHIHIDSANEEEEDGDSMSESGRSENSMLSGSLILSQSENSIAKKKYQRVDSALFHSEHEQEKQERQNNRAGFSSGTKRGSYMQLTDLEKPNLDELQVVSQEGWGFIESLQGIKFHYEHRRKMRQKYRALTRGKFIPLICELQFDSSTIHTHVLTFARFTKRQVAIVGINFNDGPIVGRINFENMLKYFPDYQNSSIVAKLFNMINPDENVQYDHFFISEILQESFEIRLDRFASTVFGLEIYENDEQKKKLAEQHSVMRLKANLQSEVPLEIQSNDIALKLYQLVQKTENLQQFVNGFSYLYHKYYKDIELNNIISLLRAFKSDNIAKNKLFAFFKALLKKEEEVEGIEEKLEFFKPIKSLIEGNTLGSICIATPEYGKYTKTGGLGVMTDELSRGLAELGETVYVVTPLYEDKRVKLEATFQQEGIKHQRNMEFWLGGEKYVVGLFYGFIQGVHLYFMHNSHLFPEAFCGEEAQYVIRQLVLYARCTLQLLCDIKVIPSVMVSNDWFSGLIPAYIKNHTYGNVFNTTKSFHIAHNLDETYEGRLYPKPNEGVLEWLHELPHDWIRDPTWTKNILNPSRCAFMTCDNWGTVSHSYKYELMSKSPLRPILATKPNAFSFPNGLNCKERLEFIIHHTGNDHLKAKEKLQKKYFGYNKLNNKIPLFGFCGRITEQKGVHLILDGFEQLLQETNYKIQIIVGGMANPKEPYAKMCADKINYLRNKYPNHFWGDPNLFFKDGPILNSGCDFGLMPSKFEPGGIVQHEFFIASTPVVATKTGGLQDTVYEYNMDAKKGTGFVFAEHTWFDMVQAIKRALKVFKDQEHYLKLRQNAFEGTIDVSDVSIAYAMEFYRMYNKNFLDNNIINDITSKMDTNFSLKTFQPIKIIDKVEGHILTKQNRIINHFEKILSLNYNSQSKLIQFKFKPFKGTFPRMVQLFGSFDDWSKTYDLKYDQFSREWKINLSLLPGEYQYKYKVDGQWEINPDEPSDQDQYMNVNNVIRYEHFLQSTKQQSDLVKRKSSVNEQN